MLGIALFHTAFFTLFFSPVWLRGQRLCFADAVMYHYPAYHGGHSLWEPRLGGGFPRFADPQFQLWYPPALVMSLLHVPFDVFVLSSYVLAGLFAHAFLRALTGSWTAGCVGGLVYGTCGFMTCHHGHTAVTHAAAWLPLVLWAVEELRGRVRPGWVAVLAVAVACCVLAGHSQVSLLCLVLAASSFVVLLPGAPAGPWAFSWAVAGGVALGLGLGMLQLLPTAELASLSGRRAPPNFTFFCASHYPRELLPALLFPYAYGLFWAPGLTIQPPLTAHTALHEFLATSTMLAVVSGFVALLSGRRQRRVWFWVAVMALAILVALGDAGPLARALFRVPLVTRFRCPARSVLWYGMGSACLSAFAVHLLLRCPPRRACRTAGIALGLTLLLAASALLVYRRQQSGPLFEPAAAAGVGADSPFRSALPWRNPALGLPLACLVLSGLSLAAYSRQRSPGAALLLLACTALDGGSFAWLWGWQTFSVPAAALSPPAGLEQVRRATYAHHTRVFGPLAEGYCWASPNLSLLAGLDNADVSTPLTAERFNEVGMLPRVAGPLFAVEYWASTMRQTPFGPMPPEPFAEGWIGGPLLRFAKSEVRLRGPDLPVAGLTVVSHLGGSEWIAQGTPVVEVLVREAVGRPSPVSCMDATFRARAPLAARAEVQAGRDTAEWAWDRQDVRAVVRHRHPPIFSSTWVDGPGPPFLAHEYVGEVRLGRAVRAHEIIFRWVGPPCVCCQLSHVCLHGPGGERYPYPGSALDTAQPPAAELPPTGVWFSRVPSPPPRAWLVGRAVTLSAEQVRETLRSGSLPDGREFDPYTTALVEGDSPQRTSSEPQRTEDRGQRTEKTGWVSGCGSVLCPLSSADEVDLDTRCAHGSVLVLADAWYPGWRVRVDGKPARLLRTDYLIRGVELPPGEHHVQFVFRPASFYLGLAVSLTTLLLTAALPLLPLLRRRAPKEVP